MVFRALFKYYVTGPLSMLFQTAAALIYDDVYIFRFHKFEMFKKAKRTLVHFINKSLILFYMKNRLVIQHVNYAVWSMSFANVNTLK